MDDVADCSPPPPSTTNNTVTVVGGGNSGGDAANATQDNNTATTEDDPCSDVMMQSVIHGDAVGYLFLPKLPGGKYVNMSVEARVRGVTKSREAAEIKTVHPSQTVTMTARVDEWRLHERFSIYDVDAHGKAVCKFTSR